MKYLLFFLLPFSLSACAEPQTIDQTAEVAATAEAATFSREAVFVGTLPKRIVLSLGGEPQPLPSGYLRLIGVVGGSRPVVLLDLAGQGLVLSLGEKVDGYRLRTINDHNICLIQSD